MVYEGVRVRSGGGRSRSTEIAKVFGAFFGRPDGFGSSDFVRLEIFLCSIDLYGCRDPILLTSLIFSPRMGRITTIFHRKTSAEILMCSP